MNYNNEFMANYGDRCRSFKHGASHGGLSGEFLALPIILTNALFERKGFKYGLLNAIYWIITLALMRGIRCQWG
jgi:hypothetical protein